jgi:hypothetical protein
MADNKATVVSGADPNGQTLRQRNVPAAAAAAGAPAHLQQDEKKIHGKKKVPACLPLHSLPMQATSLCVRAPVPDSS